MTEQQFKQWINEVMLIGVKPTRGKYLLVPVFSSTNARNQFIEHLAKKMYEDFEPKPEQI